MNDVNFEEMAELVRETMTDRDLNLLSCVENDEINYKVLKVKLSRLKKDKFINTNWGEINKTRIEQGLDKLSSDKKKEAYVDLLPEVITLQDEVRNAEIDYNSSARLYNLW